MEFDPTPEEVFEIAQGIRGYMQLAEGVESIISTLTQEHPNKWAAFDNSGIVGMEDGLDELFQQLDINGVDTRKTIVKHLDPNPKTLIL